MRLLQVPRTTLLAFSLVALASQSKGAAPSLSTINLPASLTYISATAFDSDGNVYFTGETTGSLPVTAGAAQSTFGGGMCTYSFIVPGIPEPCPDAFAAKVNGQTGAIVWATYLGGNNNDAGTGIAVDPSGNVYVTGYSFGNFNVTPNSYNPSSVPALFVSKISADGSKLLYSTLIPGAPPEAPSYPNGGFSPQPAIAVDAHGNAYVTGPVSSQSGFPSGAMVSELNANGSALVYSVFLGGAAQTSAIAVGGTGMAYITGSAAAGLPVTNGASQSKLAGLQNAFVETLDSAGKVVMATYLGGNNFDNGVAIQVDAAGNIYVGGTAYSFNFPTTPQSYLPQALLPPSANLPGGFAAKLSPSGALLFSTYIVGGELQSTGAVIAVLPDPSGGVYALGSGGPGFPVTATAPQPCQNGLGTTVTHLGSDGSLVDRTYFGYPSLSLPLGMAMAADRSVELAVLLAPPLASSYVPAIGQLNFGDGQTPPTACLSTDVVNAADFLAFGDLSGVPVIAAGSARHLDGIRYGPTRRSECAPQLERRIAHRTRRSPGAVQRHTRASALRSIAADQCLRAIYPSPECSRKRQRDL